MAKRFENQSVFITGASSGIGAALALEFAREGARVTLAARREERINEIREQIVSMGGQALAVVCDVRDRSSLNEAVAKIVETFGGIDVVVANAGFGVSGSLEGLRPDDYRRQFDTNVFGVLETIDATLRHLIASKGRLGIVSSVMGRVGAARTSAYCSSKFALSGLAESIYPELALRDVSVTLIQPGMIATEFRSVDARGKFRPGHKDPAPSWIVVPAEKAAKDIVHYLYKRTFEATITAHGKLIVFLARHFPRTFRAVTLSFLRRKMNAAQKKSSSKAASK